MTELSDEPARGGVGAEGRRGVAECDGRGTTCGNGGCAEEGGGAGAPGGAGPSLDGDPDTGIVFVAALLAGSLRPAGSLRGHRGGSAVRVVCCVSLWKGYPRQGAVGLPVFCPAVSTCPEAAG